VVIVILEVLVMSMAQEVMLLSPDAQNAVKPDTDIPKHK